MMISHLRVGLVLLGLCALPSIAVAQGEEGPPTSALPPATGAERSNAVPTGAAGVSRSTALPSARTGGPLVPPSGTAGTANEGAGSIRR